MSSARTKSGLSLPACALCAAIFAVACFDAGALNFELHPTAAVGETYDSNVFRLGPQADTQAATGSDHRGDAVLRAALGGSFTMRESLQSLEVDGEFGRDRYSRFRQLDSDHYKYSATARTAYGKTLSGEADFSQERILQSFAGRNDDAKGFQTTTKAVAKGAYAITPEWSLKPQFDALRLRYTLNESRDSDLDENAIQGAVEYQRASLSAAGLQLRSVQGGYPHRATPAGNGQETSYDQRTVSAYAEYTPSGLSDLRGELGYTQRSHDDPTVPDFAGPTGRISYRRTISGKTFLFADLYRSVQSINEIGVNYAQETGTDLLFNYMFSPKTSFALGWQWYEDRFTGSSSLDPLNTGRKDIAQVLRAGIEYEPFPRLKITPQYRYESHDSTRSDRTYRFGAASLDLDYRY